MMPQAHFEPTSFCVLTMDRSRILTAGRKRSELHKQYPLYPIITGHEANIMMGLDDNGFPLNKEELK